MALSSDGIAVVGVGFWGSNHVRVLAEQGRLKAICDIHPSAAQMANKYGVLYFQTVDDMLDNAHYGGVVLATPTTTHRDLAVKTIQAGVPTLIEKPITHSLKDALAVKAIADKAHVPVGIGYVERFNPVVCETSRLTADSQILMMDFRRENVLPKRVKDVGIIYDTMVHDLGIALHLQGGALPESVYCTAFSHSAQYEDHATITLKYDKCVVAISANWITSKKSRTFDIVCADKIVQGDCYYQTLSVSTAEQTVMPRIEYAEPLRAELGDFLSAIDNNRQPTVGIEEAAKVTFLAESALESARTGLPVRTSHKTSFIFK